VRLTIARTLLSACPPIFAQRLRGFLYSRARALHDDYSVMRLSQTGSPLRVTTSDFHGYNFAVHGYFEWRHWAVAAALCPPGATIVEVGANVGTETVGFSDIVGPTGRVLAFEPLPANAARLGHMAEVNQNRNITILPLAVADKRGFEEFVVPPSRSASGVGHLVGTAERSSTHTIKVGCVTLDSMADQIGPVRLIVTDTEGAELRVLRGARKTLMQLTPAIILEASPKLLRRAGCQLGMLRDEIESLGYIAFRIGRLSLSRVDARDGSQAHNWLCLHERHLSLTAQVNRNLRNCAILPPTIGTFRKLVAT
jgi:FkbM family methyltransferase